MVKNELMKMPVLRATKQMMELAAADSPEQKYLWGSRRTQFKNAMYLRSQVYGGILKVAIFLTEYMRNGAREAAFEVYVDREKQQFLTYDRTGNRWLTAKLDMLPWPRYICSEEKRWCSSTTHNRIKQYLSTESGGYKGLLEYQLWVRKEELKRKYKRETEPWDIDNSQVPDVPKDWERWVRKVGIKPNFIFYKYQKKGATSGYCTYCEKEVPIKKPRHNKEGVCPCCRHKITYKSDGKAGMVSTGREHMYLIQRCETGFVIREFSGSRVYSRENHQNESANICEIRRVLYDRGTLASRIYNWGEYKRHIIRWVPGGEGYYYWNDVYSGRVYGKALPSLAREELRYTGLVECIQLLGTTDPERYLNVYRDMPLLEQLTKAKLAGLVRQFIAHRPYEWNKAAMKPGISLTKLLGIDSQGLKRLRTNDGDSRFLTWLQHEKETGKTLPDRVITWFCNQEVTPKDIKFVQDRMSDVQICNYLRRQMLEMRKSAGDVLTTWADYLSMAARLKMNVRNEAVFRVRQLKKRHDELVSVFNHDKSMVVRAGKILNMYPHLEEIFQEIKDKYEYADDEYTVLVPARVEDIMIEGQLLDHCVGNSDRYWERMERRESYVLFLRHTADIERPYYTLEVEPDGTIRQKRTLGDNQEDDIEYAEHFLRKWQKMVSQRLSQEDLELAQKSRVMRLQEFEQLKQNQVRIRTGLLAGQPLLDVLLADLMEAS